MASVQLGATHAALVHTLLTQSLGARQCLLVAHGAHAAPPQSMSDSTPFFLVSLQFGA